MNGKLFKNCAKRIDAVFRPLLVDTSIIRKKKLDSFFKSTIYWLYIKLHLTLWVFLISLVMNKSYVTGCDVYTYGLNCNKRCGNCSGGVQCNHVTGTCPHGCDPGMHGNKCDKGNAS